MEPLLRIDPFGRSEEAYIGITRTTSRVVLVQNGMGVFASDLSLELEACSNAYGKIQENHLYLHFIINWTAQRVLSHLARFDSSYRSPLFDSLHHCQLSTVRQILHPLKYLSTIILPIACPPIFHTSLHHYFAYFSTIVLLTSSPSDRHCPVSPSPLRNNSHHHAAPWPGLHKSKSQNRPSTRSRTPWSRWKTR
jgi:hypothetical protein